MRAPQRNFVVEFKSRSRQPKAAKPASIWGDTDLKAVAREVEDEAGHLFSAPVGGTTTNPVVAADTTASPALAIAVEEAAVAIEPGAPLEQTTPSTTNDDISAAFADGETQPIISRKRPPVARAKSKRTTRQRDAIPSSDARVQRSRQDDADVRLNAGVTRAQLQVLERENSQLRAALRQKLVADNQRLDEISRRLR